MAEERAQWVCSTVDPETGWRPAASPTKPLPMGLAAKNSLWEKGTVLNVRFLEGTPDLHERVMTAAKQWFRENVKLSLRLAEPGEDAKIRIAFNPNGGSWSNIGTQCLAVHPSQPTMNLGWAKLTTPPDELTSVVVHEWGHALGLLHEHNHPEARVQWNKAAVYAELSGRPNYWSTKTVDFNVFKQFDESEIVVTDFDDVSVMIYTIPSRWTLDGRSFMPSSTLSSGDIATIERLYGD